MATTLTQPATRSRPALSALTKLTAAGVVGIALVIIELLVAVFGFALPPAIMTAVCIIVAGLMLTGWRWAPVLGLIPGLALPAMFAPMLIADSGSPAYLPGLLMIACGGLAAVGGVAATVQNYRRPAGERLLPRWAPIYAAVLAGAVLGASLISLQPKPAPSAGVSPEVLQALPGLVGKNFEFDQREIRVNAGETVALRLENSDPEGHMFDIDELNVHAPIPVGQVGVAVFKPTKPGTYTFYCAPHYDKTTGEGMHGTLIVE
jgi:plastocyanin